MSAYNNGQAKQVNVTTADQLVVPANYLRRYLLIQNNDAATAIYVQFGAASDAANGVKIAAGMTWERDHRVHTGDVHILGSAATGNVVVMEGV